MNKLTGYYTLRIRRIYILLLVLVAWMQVVTLTAAYRHMLAQDHEAAKQLEAYFLQLCQDMRTLTLSHCFHASDGCLEQACQTVRLPDGTPLEYVLDSR